MLDQQAYVAVDAGKQADAEVIQAFKSHPVHSVSLAQLSQGRQPAIQASQASLLSAKYVGAALSARERGDGVVLESASLLPAYDSGFSSTPQPSTPHPCPFPLQALAACAAMRPSVDISVGGDNDNTGVGAGAARTDFRSVAATTAA